MINTIAAEKVYFLIANKAFEANHIRQYSTYVYKHHVDIMLVLVLSN